MSNNVASSFLWKFFERGSSQIITMVIQIILARILLPQDFGILAIILVFVNLASIFVQKGFASSLVRKKNTSEQDYNTVFVVSEGIALLFIIIIFLIAPLIASFYNNREIILYLRVLSMSLLFGAFYSIQSAILIRNMQFRIIFYSSLFATIISGLLGIIAAYSELGIWALIIQTLSQQILLCIVTFAVCDWKPKIEFSGESFENIFSFGSKILVAELISIGVEDLRTLIIGKKFSSIDLAYYDRGQYYPSATMRGIYDTIASVMLPVLSKEQDCLSRLAKTLEKSLCLSIFIVTPLYVGLAAVADIFIPVLLTEQWNASIPYLRIFCIYQLAFPIYGIMRQCLYALGDSSAVLRLEIVRGIFFLAAIIFGCFFDTFMIAIASTVALYVTTAMYVYKVNNDIHFDVVNVARNIFVTLIQSVIMYAAIIAFNQINISKMLLLVLDIIWGCGIYVGLSVIMKNEIFSVIINFLLRRKRDGM